MIVFGVGTFVGFELGLKIVVVLGDSGGELGFFECVVADFMNITNPTTFGFVSLARI